MYIGQTELCNGLFTRCDALGAVGECGLSMSVAYSRHFMVCLPKKNLGQLFSGQMPFLSPNQQRESTKGTEIGH